MSGVCASFRLTGETSCSLPSVVRNRDGRTSSATQRQANYGPAFSAGGQRDNTTTVLVDGIEISGMELNNYPYAIPSLDSVGEFRV